jgi:hypothetical protein
VIPTSFNNSQAPSGFQTLLPDLALGALYLSDCEFSENKYNGIVLSQVYVTVKNCFFLSNQGYSIRVHSEEHSPLLKCIYQGKKDYEYHVDGLVGGPWGIIEYIDHSELKSKKTLFGCCIPAQS